MRLKIVIITLSLLFLAKWQEVMAQQVDSSTGIHVQIDEVTIKAHASNFDVHTFIQMIQNDTTFYKAFKNLRLVTFNADNNIQVFDKHWKNNIAGLTSETKQIYRDRCRTMKVLEEKVTGDFYKKNGDYRYYTAELYASLFFTKGEVCNETNIVGNSLQSEQKGLSSIEKHKAQLKQLMFNPGSRVRGIPLMGNKAAMFDPEIAQKYNFSIRGEMKNGQSCVVFEAIPKLGMEGDVVYQHFLTWFRESDYSIVSRVYQLKYSTALYRFDVRIAVDLQEKNGLLLPHNMKYQGEWRAFTQGKEYVKFNTQFYY